MERHRKQEWEFLRTQLDDQRDVLRKHMELLQVMQMKQLEAKHDRDMKDMSTQQAKVSVEMAKEVRIFHFLTIGVIKLYPLSVCYRLLMIRISKPKRIKKED